MQIGINSGAAAHRLAEFIQANVADDPSAEGIIVTQQDESIYVGADLASATISLDGEVDEA